VGSANGKSVGFINKDTGIVVGDYGSVLLTTDGGSDWEIKNIDSTYFLNSIKFLNENFAWAVGFRYDDAQGIVLSTINGGQTWSPHLILNEYGFFSVDFVDENNGWIVGWFGRVQKTTDGGQTWVGKSIPPGENLYSVKFTDLNNGWIFGGDGVIYHTNDGGINWSPQSSGAQAHLFSGYFVDQSYGWAVGAAGLIVKTTNGGINWIDQSVKSSDIYNPYYFSSIYLIDRNTGWIVGNGGIVFKTTDGGGVTSVDYNNPGIDNFSLNQNYPNPFNPTTNIGFRIASASGGGFVTLKVYDILGREVATLVNEEKPAGNYEVEFDGGALASGIYFYKLQTGNYTSVKKMILIK